MFLYTPIDEFVMGNLAEYDGRKLVSAETGGIDLTKDGGRSSTDEKKKGGAELASRLRGWMALASVRGRL